MSTTQPNENVKLTFEQLQQIDTVEKRLANLQSELGVGRNNLTAIRLECETVTRERLYQEELLAGLKVEVSVLEEKKVILTKENAAAAESIAMTSKRDAEIKEEHYAKTTEILEQRKTLEQQKEEFKQAVDDFTIKSSRLLEDQLSIKTAKDAFLKASETVTW